MEVIFMADVTFTSPQSCSSENTYTDAVCINASRIYDSCGSKDCLNNLNVYFTPANQMVLQNACSVRICKASVITSKVEVEPVAFHRGFYAVDVTFYFDIGLEVYSSGCSIPSTINGLAVYGKRVVLYGSEGNSKSFSSDTDSITCEEKTNCCTYKGNTPRATVQISEPMALSAELKCTCHRGAPLCNLPECVLNYFGDNLSVSTEQSVTATIGIFTITQLERNVQIMIPSYEFCIPRKECATKSDDPCEVFSKVDFPNASFFPPNAREEEKERYSFECGCSN